MNLKEKCNQEKIALNSLSDFLTNVIVNISVQIEPVALFCLGKVHKAVLCATNNPSDLKN